jgi:rod shape-determining protein MreD
VKQGFWSRLETSARAIFPFLITMALAMVAAMPLRVPELSAIMPAFSLIAVYHFTVYLPRLMPFWVAFLVGVFQDLVFGLPLGVSAIVFLSVQAIINARYRNFAKAGFSVGWCLFLVVAAGAFVLGWGLTSIGLMVLLDPRPAIFQFLLTGAFYPVLTWLMILGQRAFQESDL